MAFVHTVASWALGAGRITRGLFRSVLLMTRAHPGTATAPRPVAVELPLRAELFSAEQMECHGIVLARAHSVGRVPVSDRLLRRLAENEAALIKTCDLLIAATAAGRRIGPSGEWLLDNLYLVEEQIRTAKRYLPEGFSAQLPRLQNGPSAGRPRVYDIALETIAHGDGRVDRESISRFISAYQTVTPLTLGELWAVPIMLRLALIENLRRVALGVAAARADRDLAESWADRMAGAAERDPNSLILIIADMARSDPPVSGPFVAELVRRLQGRTSALALPLTWIEQRLSESGSSIEQLVHFENQQQATDQVSISNSIGSLRFLSALDWRLFVESMSLVERTLTGDPAGVYRKQDFATRDRYRHVVEALAQRSVIPEHEVAAKAVKLAQAGSRPTPGDVRADHVGFYLIGAGLAQLEEALGARSDATHRIARWCGRAPLALYLGSIALFTLAFASLFVRQAYYGDVGGAALAAVGLFGVLAGSELAVSLVNVLATSLKSPQILPRMDFSTGIPAECRTLVVVPTMLTSAEGVEDLVEALEVRFLANRVGNIHFGLLTDFSDASREALPEDEALLALAVSRIEELNRRYSGAPDAGFFLFHRPRRWNARERVWMGHERKRGKLSDLNALLRGGPEHAFSRIIGEKGVLSGVRYVITLDTDTQLPRDSARHMIEAIAHPLNRARYDGDKQRITAGYGILQPRVAASLPERDASRYARLLGGEPGIDPYTRAVSDVYQDLFGEGSFIGKGIYDVDAFEHALEGQLPQNRILSHDLLEGNYARSGLLSDVQLYEKYPTRYSADAARRHRWMRGDWQIASWILRNVPHPRARTQRNPLSALSRWKILDNLRRSVTPFALVGLLLLSWMVLSPVWPWTFAVVGVVLVSPVAASLFALFRRPDEVTRRQHLATIGRSAGRHCAQGFFVLACLPYEAFYGIDAMLRSTVRIMTKRRLLEWTTASEAERATSTGLLRSYRTMWSAPVTALAAAISVGALRPTALVVAAPILLLWFAAPAIAWWVSRPYARREARLTAEDVVFLRKMSRRTWAYFEEFVAAGDNYLPPDNYQQHPGPVVAHRTSPTNMGISALANVCAYDFGFAPAGELLERTARAFESMERLERYKGHFYNWYDTQTLKPLLPLYVSSVDSGNLACYLMVLKSALLALPDDRIVHPQLFAGLADTLRLLLENAPGLSPDRAARIENHRLSLESTYSMGTLAVAYEYVARLALSLAEAARSLEPAADNEGRRWAEAAARQAGAAVDDMAHLAPWLALPGASAPVTGLLQPLAIPTLAELANLGGPYGDRARERITTIERLARVADTLSQFEYDFLFDAERQLLTIGYNVTEQRCDPTFYDLLASEARTAVFVGIAQQKLPQESWFALGRLLSNTAGAPTLLSWSGSMFEYLMPLLVMPTYEHTLLDQSYRTAVERQIAYGNQRGVPWGSSESGYYTLDAALNYQYRAFGVPGLGLARGLADDLVIAPYASALALMVAPAAACRNLRRLANSGAVGEHGFFEAIDYAPARLPPGQASAVVRSFMTHHQGMTLLSFAYQLLGRPMQKRWAALPEFQATALLLQERIPKASAAYLHHATISGSRGPAKLPQMPVRVLTSADTPAPEVQLLSNGRYHVMVTNAGGGYSRWKDLAITRWREDPTCDNWGTFCYVRDVASNTVWSTAHQPTRARADAYQAMFSEARVEFHRSDHDYETRLEIVVSPEDDIELRRLHLRNCAGTARVIELTSYAEVVLAPAAADASHPAFSKLFVQTEIIENRHAILCTRRGRSVEEHVPWMFHRMAVHGPAADQISYETDRARFIGRGRTLAAPLALDEPVLSGTAGSVLDPIVAIRYRVTLRPNESVTVDMVSGAADTREACLGLVGKYEDPQLAERVIDLSWTHSLVTLRQINMAESDAQLYGRLAGFVLYASASLRADAGTLIRNRRGQPGLWGYAISGDLPIVLLQIGDIANIDLVRQLVQAHAYWRLKGLAVDLIIWNEDRAGYRQLLQDRIMGLIAAGVEAQVIDRPGGIFVRRADQIADEDRLLLRSVARAIISDERGALSEQVVARGAAPVRVERLKTARASWVEPVRTEAAGRPPLLFDNDLGGYSADGREYVITTAPGHVTPAPWANVLANAYFGTIVSESGPSYTWSENAHEFRLTPWGNDPVTDASGEAYYIRDEETGRFWSPTPLPCRGTTPYITRHGFGYSVYEHTEDGIDSELTIFVALDAPIKFSVLKVRNDSGRRRRLSATGYVEWVLGELREKTAMHVVTEIEPTSGAVCARNAYNAEFSGRVAFFDVNDATRSITGDRSEFVGRNGTLESPSAMKRARLSNRLGAGFDPCAALHVAFDLVHGEARELIFRLGAAGGSASPTHTDARTLLEQFRGATAQRRALDEVASYWRRTLGAVQVATPDAALDVLANGWLVYQALACRMWARSGYYQSGGAFGFRDQLQDAMALVHTEPRVLRDHLLVCAGRQFREGDVQHWWHPPSGRGVRTRCSDDLLWLPLAIARYIGTTGDTGVLDATAHFLEGRLVNVSEDSYYDLPRQTAETASLHEHAVRAISRALSFGAHGLPLMGTGDWNDGMNLVGEKGLGESVWLAFFLYQVLVRYSDVAEAYGDQSFADKCRAEAARLQGSIEQHGWDGEWYRRAYFDDGTPLGSRSSPECAIDAISQSWSVLSGAADSARSRLAMDALEKHLVRRSDGLIGLLTPPFDKSSLNPGYIKGYVPGVRENGGQYTHSAIWAVMAFAELRDSKRAWDLCSLINPVNHASDRQGLATYAVEPYVITADIYAVPPHTGRGGWTWYTGSAGWMYRLILESLLGLRREAERLRFEPCLPAHWDSIRIDYRYRETIYHITMRGSDPQTTALAVTVDGVAQPHAAIVLVDDGVEHHVTVWLAAPANPQESEDVSISAASRAASPATLA